MVDVLEQGLAWLEDRRKRHLSRKVIYQRGTNSAEINATIGRTLFEQADESGILQRIESRDYLLAAADLVLAGMQTVPQAGDRVRESDGDRVFVYEVMAPGTEPPYRFSDPYRRTLRIHTKGVGVETV